MNIKESRGVTLPEMMVAIVVLSLLSLMGQQVLRGVHMVSESQSRYAQQLNAMQKAMQILQHDLTQMVPRTVRGPWGGYQGLQAGADIPEPGGSGFRFVRAGRANPEMSRPESHLLQVSYRVFNGQLERWTWPVASQRETLKPRIQKLLAVDAMTTEFYDGSHWQTLWQSNSVRTELPAAVRIKIINPSVGKVERIWLVGGNKQLSGESA
ncbi:TPA: type II secretion system minor pseudopilin GspJ [Salmonella enterica subsp. enterica serovar Virchow]